MKLRTLLQPSPETIPQAELLYRVTAYREQRKEGLRPKEKKPRVVKEPKVKKVAPPIIKCGTKWWWLDEVKDVAIGPFKRKKDALEVGNEK